MESLHIREKPRRNPRRTLRDLIPNQNRSVNHSESEIEIDDD